MDILVFNQDWFVEEWRAQGHNVLTVGYSQHLDIVIEGHFIDIHKVLEDLEEGFVPEWIIFHDNSSPLPISGLEDCKTKIAFYSVDTHHHCFLHSKLADTFDLVFVAQKDYLKYFEGKRAKAVWLPLWASKEVETSLEKKYDAIFVGTMRRELNPERVDFFERLARNIDIEIFQGAYWEYFPFAELVVNQTVRKDLNFRVFEAMMCGPLLLTEETENGLTEIFTPGEDLLLYEKGNEQDAAEKVRACLADRAAMRAIAARGREKVWKNHRPVHRAETVMQWFQSTPASDVPRSVFAPMMNYIEWARHASDPAAQLFAVSGYASAMKSLMLGVERSEKLDEESGFFAVMACLGFDKVTNRNSGKKALSLLADRYPHLRTVGVGQLVAMSDDGERDLIERLTGMAGLPGLEFIQELFSVD